MSRNSLYSFEELQLIEKYNNQGLSYSSIALSVNRSKNGIMEVIKSNGGRYKFTAVEAMENRKKRIAEGYEKVRQKTLGKKHIHSPSNEIKFIKMQLEIIFDELKDIREILNGKK